MRYYADLHIHSRYSRATSRDMSPESLWRWAQIKGITVIGTGDITHPLWFKELDEKIEPAGNGLYALRKAYMIDTDIPMSCRADVFFVPSAEISCIYRKGTRTRKVHVLLVFPDLGSAAK